MARRRLGVAAVMMLALLAIPARGRTADQRPENVPPMRVRYLSPPRYRSLFLEWRQFAEKHPRDADAWVQAAQAAYYANESCSLIVRWARRAVQLAPRNPDALTALGRFGWWTYCPGQPEDPAASIRLLQRALEIDPLQDNAHYFLWVMLGWQGKRAEADRHLAVLLDNGRMPEPLVDFGYNLLVGLEPDAILVTNGDNDTYPTVALQTARGVRSDVAVVNLGMLNLLWYRRELARGSKAIPVPALESLPLGEGGPEAFQGLLANLKAEGWKRPVYVAVTVDGSRIKPVGQLSLEGIVYRVADHPGELTINEKAMTQNLEQRYRRESATSPAVDWKRWASLPPLVQNYTAADWQLGQALYKRGDRGRARSVVERVLSQCEFHQLREVGATFVECWRGQDPQAPRLAYWRKRFSK